MSVEYPPTVGGVATSCRRLTRTLVGAGFDVHVIVPLFGTRGEATTRQAEDCTVYEIPIDLSAGLQRASFVFLDQVRRIDRKVRFDLFHSFFLNTAFPCALLAGTRPLLVSIRGGDMVADNHPDIRATAVFSLQKARWVTSVNQLYLDAVRELVNLDGRCEVLRNGVEGVPAADRWRLATCQRGEMGMVGQFRRVKDVPLLVRGYAATTADSRRALHLFGRFTESKEEAWTQTLVEEFGLRSEVFFHGELAHAEVLRRLTDLHVYVQTSAFEGLPNSLLEAAARGLPIVATAVGGMAEILRHEESALLVPHGDVRALAAALTRVLSEDLLAEHLGRGSARLAEELSSEREQQRWCELYRQLLS